MVFSVRSQKGKGFLRHTAPRFMADFWAHIFDNMGGLDGPAIRNAHRSIRKSATCLKPATRDFYKSPHRARFAKKRGVQFGNLGTIRENQAIRANRFESIRANLAI